MEQEENRDYLVCPECGQSVQNILSHYRNIHDNQIKNKEQFRKRYPDYQGKFQISYRTKGDFNCPHCGKHYDYKNGLQLHIKKKHPEFYQKPVDCRRTATLECPICHRKLSGIRYHIRMMHGLDWETFCRNYSWNPRLSKVLDEEYHSKLSENKKAYYESERGRVRKEKQSVWMKQRENNPVFKKGSIEKSIYSRASRGHSNALGYAFGTKVLYQGNTFRSWNEFLFYEVCRLHGVELEYEPNRFCVKWNKEEGNTKFLSTYLPDFYSKEYGLIELKESAFTVRRCREEEKYVKVSKIYAKLNVPYEITFPTRFYKKIGIEYTFKDFDYIKELVRKAAYQNEIEFYTKFGDRGVLVEVFGTDCLENTGCVHIVKVNGKKK